MKVPTVYALKPGFQGILRPAAHGLVRAGLTANQVTVLAGALSGILGLLLSLRPHQTSMFLLLAPFLLLRMALNAIDGIMARECGQRSALGAYLNEIADVMADSILYLPFALAGVFDPLWMGVVIVLSVTSEMAGVVAVLAGSSRRYDGPLGKSDRALVFGALGLWLGCGLPVAPAAARAVPACLALLLMVTIVNRVKKGLNENAHRNPQTIPGERRSRAPLPLLAGKPARSRERNRAVSPRPRTLRPPPVPR